MRIVAIALVATLSASTAVAETLTVASGQSIQSVVNRAKPGDTIRVEPGLYKETVYIDKDNIHLTGVIRDGKWPVMDGETTRNDGILVSGHNVIIERMHVKRYMGNGIMTQGSNNFIVRGNQVEGPGFYGIFPQYGKNGLVTNNVVHHIKGTAIYVGMSQNIDVTYNETFDNDGFGIELENSSDALVEGNYTHGNTVGIVLNLIPGLPIKGLSNMIVRNNFIEANDARTDTHTSTASSASVIDSGAGQHPQGTGLLINAGDTSTIENNVFRDNPGAPIFIMDHNFGQLFPVPDPKVDPLPDGNRLLHNTFIGNGTKPYGRTEVLLKMVKKTEAPSLLMAGRGRKNCIADKGSVTTVGADDWTECPAGASSSDITTMRLAKPVESPSLTLTQKGRLTYLAVCTGCHSYTTRIFGPPMMAARAPYMGNPQKLADWIAKPTKNRSDYPAMPPQGYLPPEIRLEVARYVLERVEP